MNSRSRQPSQVHFKLASLDDLPILMNHMQAFHEFDHITPFDTNHARTAMEKVVTDKTVGRVWLIQQATEQQATATIGYIVLTLGYRLEYRGDYGFLDELYIREDKRGQGIGTQALLFLHKACVQLKLNKLQLEVRQDNPRAAALYERAGFEFQSRDMLVLEC
ncbi:MAG: GNAT family N-acetyltransferase [Cyanobacteria bacterium J06634_5]